jgi:hypothetical protein
MVEEACSVATLEMEVVMVHHLGEGAGCLAEEFS